jgi:C-terminal processing protease CtpA/Prc
MERVSGMRRRVHGRRPWLLAGAVLLSACALSPRGSQGSDDAWRAEAVESVAAIMEERYPWPDTAQMISAHLRARHGSGAYASVGDALRTLDGTAAMILDMRGMPGGSAAMANLLISHFTPPGVLSVGVENPATGETTHTYTLDEVPGPRRTEVPLHVLVDGRSASAAEAIPFVLQNLGRATIVGERTIGAGRNVQGVQGALGLTVWVSTTRVFDPATGREWERVGVEPDIATAPEDALAAALEHARASPTAAASEPRPTEVP